MQISTNKSKDPLENIIENFSQDNSIPWIKLIGKHPLQTMLVLLGGGLLMVSAVYLIANFQKGSEAIIIPAEEAGSNNASQIMVHVAGAVEKPGLYKLETDARVNDALVLAGGLAETANRQWFSKNINLAQKLSDGVKLYIPFANEENTKAGAEKQTININTASQKELESLPKIGPVTALKIIEYREKNGQFQNIDDLVKVNGVSQSMIDLIRDKITAY